MSQGQGAVRTCVHGEFRKAQCYIEMGPTVGLTSETSDEARSLTLSEHGASAELGYCPQCFQYAQGLAFVSEISNIRCSPSG